MPTASLYRGSACPHTHRPACGHAARTRLRCVSSVERCAHVVAAQAQCSGRGPAPKRRGSNGVDPCARACVVSPRLQYTQRPRACADGLQRHGGGGGVCVYGPRFVCVCGGARSSWQWGRAAGHAPPPQTRSCTTPPRPALAAPAQALAAPVPHAALSPSQGRSIDALRPYLLNNGSAVPSAPKVPSPTSGGGGGRAVGRGCPQRGSVCGPDGECVDVDTPPPPPLLAA